jgi:hypothetical protein
MKLTVRQRRCLAKLFEDAERIVDSIGTLTTAGNSASLRNPLDSLLPA